MTFPNSGPGLKMPMVNSVASLAGYGVDPNQQVGGVMPPTDYMNPVSTQLMSSSGYVAPAANTGSEGILGGLGDWFKNSGFLNTVNKDGTQTQGFGMPLLGTVQGIGNALMAMKQYGLAKDSLAEGKRQYEQNYAAQRSTTNASLQDRQRARVASNAGAYQSVEDYMAQYGVK